MGKESYRKLLSAAFKSIEPNDSYNDGSIKDNIPEDFYEQYYKKESFIKDDDRTAFFVGYKEALEKEILYIRTGGEKRKKAFDGRLVEKNAGKYIYSFEIDEESNLPNGTQLSIWIKEKKYLAEVIDCDDFILVISVRENIGQTVSVMEYIADTWRLLQSLIDRLTELQPLRSSEIVENLLSGGKKAIVYTRDRLNRGQEKAVQMALSQPITFIWGPPGTGKTETLARISWKLIRENKKILMLSYSNVSVDGAILRTFGMNQDTSPGVLLRYGYPKNSDLRKHDYLTSYNLAIRNHPELKWERESLILERKKTPKESKRYVEIVERLAEIRKELKEEEEECVERARFVATTVTKATVDPVIYGSKYDAVIIDEVSMTYVPHVVFAASLAKSRFICLGDFKQLPPIVQSGEDSVLNQDIFDYCGITEAVENGDGHRWLCMLDIQFRMHPEISGFASRWMYKNLLRSSASMQEKRKSTIMAAPYRGKSIEYVNLSGMMSVCTRTGDNSRINLLSAFIAISLAMEAAENGNVGIIVPYRSQAKILFAMAADISAENPDLHRITCATVHQFQGSESDVIIYDAVDCFRMRAPGIMLSSMKNNYANRLFNVAMTRARGKFIGISNEYYFSTRNMSRALMFRQLMDLYRDGAARGENIIQSDMIPDNSCLSFWNSCEAAKDLFLQDLRSAKKTIHFDIPDRPADNILFDQIIRVLKSAEENGVSLYLRSEKPDSLPEAVQGITTEARQALNPIVIIDDLITWYGMPETTADFIVTGDRIKTDYRPVFRIIGLKTARVLYGYLQMSRVRE